MNVNELHCIKEEILDYLNFYWAYSDVNHDELSRTTRFYKVPFINTIKSCHCHG